MDRPTRYGIFILQDSPWPDMVERVRWYEAIGFETVWVADHFVSPWHPPGPWLEAWTLLAGLAAQTSRIRLGPLISHPLYHNPAVLARQAMTVDRLSGGRFELGLGAGASYADAPTTGSPWRPPAERVARFREAATLIDRLLSQEVTTFEGRYYRVESAWMNPGPVQRPRPRLTIAASGPGMVKLAAALADVWNTEGSFQQLYERGASPADVCRFARERSELLSEEAARLGREPESIVRSFLFGFGAAPEDPWASVAAFDDIVGRYREIGFSEFIFPEPDADQMDVLERVAEVMPASTGAVRPAPIG